MIRTTRRYPIAPTNPPAKPKKKPVKQQFKEKSVEVRKPTKIYGKNRKP